MVRKKLIFASLFALLSIPLFGKQTDEKRLKTVLNDAFNTIVKALETKTSPRKIRKIYDEEFSLHLNYGPYQTFFENRLKKKYKEIKENTKNVYIACIKNNPKEKLECQKLVNTFVQINTNIKLEAFLAEPKKTRSNLFFEELDEHA